MTREEYKDKFDQFMREYAYIKQNGEEIIQIEEVPYYFFSNKGYMFSVYGKTLRFLKPCKSGKKGKKKDGADKRQAWEWKDSHGQHLRMTTMAAKYFPNRFDTEEFHYMPEMTYQNHHMYCNGWDMSISPQQLNRAEDLQQVPEHIHEFMTQEQKKTWDEVSDSRVTLPAGLPVLKVDLESFIKSGNILMHPYMIVFEYDKKSMKCQKSYIKNIDRIEVIEDTTHSE